MEASQKNSERLYCIHTCPIGVAKSAEFLQYNNSAFDAAFDMDYFIDTCKKTCPRYNNSETK